MYPQKLDTYPRAKVSLKFLFAFYFSLFFSMTLFGQAPPPSQKAPPVFPAAKEFPAIMRQSVVAGKTLVGTKVQAKLEVATLVEGKVFPTNAVLEGEVTESEAKTADAPSRLSIRMDSVRTKKVSAAIKVYLTAWYYPMSAQQGQNLQYGPPQSPTRTWNGQGAYPNPNSGSYKPFPGSDPDADTKSVPDTASTKMSDHHVSMKEVSFESTADGGIALVSRHDNIKLDKLTVYVFAASDLFPAK
jgi:hypothetical protein